MPRQTFVPTVVYRDPLNGLKWLERAFGFETTLVVTDAEGNVGHSEMSFGEGVISIGGEWSGPPFGAAVSRSPLETGGAMTQFLRVHLKDGLDAHCERARAAGAEIVAEPAEQFYGARVYRAVDPEGHVWSFSQESTSVPIAEQEAETGLKIHTSLEDAGHG